MRFHLKYSLIALSIVSAFLLFAGTSAVDANHCCSGEKKESKQCAVNADHECDGKPEPGHCAPAFEAKGLDGTEYKLADLRGHHPVILTFWATT